MQILRFSKLACFQFVNAALSRMNNSSVSLWNNECGNQHGNAGKCPQ